MIDDSTLLAIIAFIAVFVSFLLATFLLTVKSQNRKANILLAVFVLLNAVDLSGWFSGSFLREHLNLLMLKNSLSYLINPVFYLYAQVICFSDFKLRPRHLLHGIPFLLYNLLMVPEFYLVGEEAKVHFLQYFNDSYGAILNTTAAHTLFFIYIAGIFLTLRRFRTLYLENYTDSTTITYRWLFQLTVVDTVVHTIVVIKDVIGFGPDPGVLASAQILVAVNAVFILCWFVLKALYRPDLFRGVDSTMPPVETLISKVAPGHRANSPKNLSGKNTEVQRLKEYMDSKEPFLDASLTVQGLAQQLNMPARDLSILINHHLGQHFFDFVNEYRIKKAMHILKDPGKSDFTVLEILYEVGFNSKSSFNTAFKKYTNLTPTQFRNG